MGLRFGNGFWRLGTVNGWRGRCRTRLATGWPVRLGICGLDLRKPCNVRALATCIKPKVLEVREMERSDLPDWYRWPQRQEAA